MHIVFTVLMIAALSVVLLLVVLAGDVDNAIILLPAFLAIGFTVHQEVVA